LIKKGRHSEVVIYSDFVIKKFKAYLYSNFLKEKTALNKLKKYNFVPQIIESIEKELIIKMEKVEGIELRIIIKNSNDTKFLLNIFKIIFKICFILDIEGIYKDEWNRPFKHVIINDKTIKIIDFDRCLICSEKKNLPQFLSFVFNFFNLYKDYKQTLIEYIQFLEKQISAYKTFGKP